LANEELKYPKGTATLKQAFIQNTEVCNDEKSTVLYTFLFFFLFVGWGVTPALADCPHNVKENHRHCLNIGDSSSFVLKDGLQRPFGTIMEVGLISVKTAVKIDDATTVVLTVIRGVIETREEVRFLDNNCDGVPFGNHSGSSPPTAPSFDVFTRAWVVIDRNGNRNLYVPDGPEEVITPISVLSSGVCNILNQPGQNLVVPLELKVLDLDTTFPPPYTLEIR